MGSSFQRIERPKSSCLGYTNWSNEAQHRNTMAQCIVLDRIRHFSMGLFPVLEMVACKYGTGRQPDGPCAHRGAVSHVSIQPISRQDVFGKASRPPYILSASTDQTARLWDSNKLTCSHILRGRWPYHSGQMGIRAVH